MKIEGIDKETGEIMKRYELPSHAEIKNEITKQTNFVHRNFRDPKDPDKFARLDGDTLSMVLMELTGMYEYLGKWLADERLHLADMKTEYDIKFANRYCELKALKSETNETARMKSQLICADDQKEINQHKHGLEIIEAWKKSIGRYHDAVRSQLSYEKSLGNVSRG